MRLTCKTNLDPTVITRLFTETTYSLIWRLTLHLIVGSTHWQTNRRNEGEISWQKRKLLIVTISSFFTKVSTIFNNHTFIYRDVICFRFFKMCLKEQRNAFSKTSSYNGNELTLSRLQTLFDAYAAFDIENIVTKGEISLS